MRLTRRRLAGLCAGFLLLSACDGEEPDPPPIGGEENGNETNVESNGEDDDPYAVPEEIDEEYAEAVVNALLEITTDALKIALEQEQGAHLAPEAVDRLHAVTVGTQREFFTETFQHYIDDPELADGYLPVDAMGSSRFEAHGILHAEPANCILVAGWWNRTEIARAPPDDQSLFSLSPLDRNVTALDRNPTPWRIREIDPMLIDGEPIPEEHWDEINFGDALDRTCEGR